MSMTVLGLSADHLLSHSWSTHHRCLTTSPSSTVSTSDPAPTSPTLLDGIDPSFVFDFEAYDDLDDDGQRWSTWLSVEPLCRGPEPRPDWVVTSQGAIDTELGILKTGKEADVFLVERADPARPRRRRRDGRQALPQHRAPHLPPRRDLHRGPQHEALPRRARAQAQEHLGQGRRRRRVGGLGVGRAQALLGARPAGPLPRADRRHRDPDGVDHRRRRDRAAARPDPPGARSCSRRTSTSCGRRWPRWCSTGSCTATCRRTTSWPRASGW